MAADVDAKSRPLERLKIGETEQKSRGNKRRDRCDQDRDRKTVLPKEVKAKDT